MMDKTPEKGADSERPAELSIIPAEDSPGVADSMAPQPWSWDLVMADLRRAWRLLSVKTSRAQLRRGLLIAILLLAAALRFTGLNWDEHQHLHPDERFLTMVENSLEWPESFRQYLDSSANPLNPYNRGHGTYVYGLLPIVVTKFVGQIVGKTGYDGIYLVGRALSGVMDILCVLLVYLTGRRLYDSRVGLLGALLLSVTVLNIQQSHFFTVDTATTLYVTLALYLAVRVAQGDGWGSVVGMAAAFGLAVAAKISVLSFLLVIGLAYMLRYLVAQAQSASSGQGPVVNLAGRLGRMRLSLRIDQDTGAAPESEGERLFAQAVRTALSLIVVLLIAAFVFRLAQPLAFSGPGLLNFKLNPQWKDNMSYVQKLVSGEIDYPPSHQWAAREPIWYMLKNQLLWGMGLPLGLTVWASWALMGYELYRKHKWAHLLPWVWIAFTFFYQSIQFVKTIRYLLPIYPAMALIAGYGLIWLWDRARAAGAQRTPRVQRLLQRSALGLIGAIVLSTAFWAIAFTTIYTRPVTRLTASRWIYANLPQGSTIGWEVWDDPLPLNVDGHNASIEVRQLKMDLYWEDLPEKRQQIYDVLREAQYISLSSNRLYGSIPRLPTRYPMTTRYYEALFSGELGFDPYMTFTSRPKLFGIEFVDDDADESFTVYDHPKVILFKKRPDFSMAQVQALFDDYELERIVRVMPKQITSAPNNLMLDQETWRSQREGGTWSRIFDRESLANRLPLVLWLLAICVIGLVGYPYAFVAFRRFRDRGYILGRTLGMLLLGYLSWLLPSLRILPYTRGTILLMLGLLFAGALAIGYGQRRAIRQHLRERWRSLVTTEVLFLIFFAAFLLIRLGNPDLWHPAMGGEKPMDLAYLNAIIKSTYFPPYDPWFAGGYLNYYYFGWVIVATLVKLTGIVPTTAYNLVLPTFFALVAMGACTIASNLIRPSDDERRWFPRALRYGLLAALMVAVLGNLGEIQLLLQGFQQLGEQVQFESQIPGLVPLMRTLSGLWAVIVKGKELPFRSEWWYWNASRIMKHGEINEFPFFTFLYADLHAHLTAMPFALLALNLAASFVVRQRKPADGGPLAEVTEPAAEENLLTETAESLAEALEPVAVQPIRIVNRLADRLRQVDWGLGLQLTLLALALGELWCNNSWDFPTYTGVAIVAIALGLWADVRRIDQRSITALALRVGYVLVLSLLLYRPYHANFGLAYSSVEPWKGEQTPLGHYLLIHGPALFVLASYLVTLLLDRRTRNTLVRSLRVTIGHRPRRGRAQQLYSLLVRGQTLSYEAMWLGLGGVLVIVVALFLKKAWVPLLALPLLILSVALFFSRRMHTERRFALFLVGLGVLLTLAVEYIVIKGDIGRMNTVFKFYLQVWIMWGVVGAVALSYLAKKYDEGRGIWRLWHNVLLILLICVSLYPIFATQGKLRDRWDRTLGPGLDGTRYMTTARYHDNNRELVLEHDRLAIEWLQENVDGSPVIAEANTPLYRWGNRVSIYTGLPTIIGWDWHQKQQRAAVSGQVVDWRIQDVRDLYDGQSVDKAIEILSRYQVSYIMVGELERAYYNPQGLAKFDSMVGTHLEIAYLQGPVRIYRVIGSEGDARAFAPPSGRSAWGWLQRNWVPRSVKAQGPEKRPSGNLAVKPPSPTLMLDTPVEELPVMDSRGWNPLAAKTTWGAILTWWLILQLLGLAAWPIATQVFRRFADRGYALSKALGLLFVGYLLWIGSSVRLYANSPPAAGLVLLALGACSFFLWRRQRFDPHASPPLDKRLVLIEEVLFSTAFLAFVGLRILNPDLWQPWFGGEKMMEIAFLNALTKSAYMPPYDPYFSGGYINYYYFGHFLVSTLIKLTGTVPEIGFNLAVPTFFGLTVSHAFGLGYHLTCGMGGLKTRRPLPVAQTQPAMDNSPLPVAAEQAASHPSPSARASRAPLPRRSLWAGAACVILVTIIGNLTAPIQLLEGLARVGGASFSSYSVTGDDVRALATGLQRVVTGEGTLPPFDYWYRGTRIIPYTINEFPFFSFLFADLHPHMIGLPFTILVAALSLALLMDRRRGMGVTLLRWGVLGVAVGALGTINTWDLPLYWGIAGSAMLYRGYLENGRRGLLTRSLSLLVLMLVALLLYAPYYAHYRAQHVGLSLVPEGDRSDLAPFLAIWGLFLFLVLSAVLLWLGRIWPWKRVAALVKRRGGITTMRRLAIVNAPGLIWWAVALLSLALSLGGSVYLALNGRAVPALLLPLALAAGVSLLRSGRDVQAFVRRLMILAGLGILLGVEAVYMQDFLSGGEWRRMNTVFKFHLQAWVVLGLACGSLLPSLWERASRARIVPKGLWRGAFALLLGSSLLYTAIAIPIRVNERFASAWPRRGTLDGTAYMRTGIYAWPGENDRIDLKHDRDAIEWLWENVQGTPVLVEAPIGFYREGGLRISSYTGLPTLVGAHQREQRPWEQVGVRERDAELIYTTTDAQQLMGLLNTYHVRYIYVGQLERTLYAGPALDKFEALAEAGQLQRAYQNTKVTIYHVL